MRLSTQTRYAVRAVFDIAYNSKGLEEIQVKEISKRQGISQRYLEQIFQKLKKAGLIASKRGPTGGYFLTKKPEEITVGEIARITERTIEPVPCLYPRKSDQTCGRVKDCVVRIIWMEAGGRLKEYLDSVTIGQLCKMAEEMGVKKGAEDGFMYYI